MNTDIRIDWRSGMEITPQTFVDMENNISENRLLVRKMIAAKWFGIIPGTKFSVSHEILNGCLVLKQVVCDVLLPTGQVAVVETKAPITLNIPDKEVDGLYLTLEVGDHLVSFEKDGVPHVVNEYHFDFKALSEIGNRQPLLKLVQNNGAWSVYENYVPPIMSVRSSVPLLEKLGELKQAAEKIVHHEHFDLMEDPVLVLTLIDQLETFSPDDSLRELVLLDRRIAVALSYAVMKQKVELSVPNIMDVEPYLNVFKQFLEDIAVAMNDLQPKVVEVVKEPEPEPEPEPEIWCPQI
ncbi:MAG: hypothetical protein IKU00_09085 [Bacteroidales bacterium]|nr:hypothetical protein [Bacteroidales bacterium]